MAVVRLFVRIVFAVVAVKCDAMGRKSMAKKIAPKVKQSVVRDNRLLPPGKGKIGEWYLPEDGLPEFYDPNQLKLPL